MVNIGWRMDGLLSSFCHCLIKFNIFTLNSVSIFAKLFFRKNRNVLKSFIPYKFLEYSNQPCNCTLYISLKELSTCPNTFQSQVYQLTQLCTFSCQNYQTLFLYLNFKINDVTRFKTCVFPSCVGQLVKVNKTGAVIKMVEWSELLKIIFSIILQPHK